MDLPKGGDTVSPPSDFRDSTVADHRKADDSATPIMRAIKGQHLVWGLIAGAIAYGILLNKVDTLVEQQRDARSEMGKTVEKIEGVQRDMNVQTKSMIEQGSEVRGLSNRMVSMENRMTALEGRSAEVARNTRRP